MRYLGDIEAKLTAECAVNLTDAEIERVFKDCVCQELMISLAKKYRDGNMLRSRQQYNT